MRFPSGQNNQPSFRKVFGPVLAFLITFYFVYHIFQGERGIISWFVLSKKVQHEENKLDQLIEQKEQIARRVSLLNPNSIDLDLLEELARKLLNYSKKNEIIVYDKTPQNIPLDLSKGTVS